MPACRYSGGESVAREGRRLRDSRHWGRPFPHDADAPDEVENSCPAQGVRQETKQARRRQRDVRRAAHRLSGRLRRQDHLGGVFPKVGAGTLRTCRSQMQDYSQKRVLPDTFSIRRIPKRLSTSAACSLTSRQVLVDFGPAADARM